MRMKSTFQPLAISILLSSAWARDVGSLTDREKKECDSMCKQDNKVCDGMDGNYYQCRSSSRYCPSAQTYEDPVTGDSECCPYPKVFITDEHNSKKGECCNRDQVYVWDSKKRTGKCQKPQPPHKNDDDPEKIDVTIPGTCNKLIHGSMAHVLGPILQSCLPDLPLVWNTIIEEHIAITINNIKNIILLQEKVCNKNPTGNEDDENCPADGGPPCHWLKTQVHDRQIDASPIGGKVQLKHPNLEYDSLKHGNNTHYWYTVDTWLTAESGAELDVYIKNKKLSGCNGQHFFIPAGTLADDVYVRNRSPDPIKYSFYGAETKYTPCVEQTLLDWQYGAIALQGQTKDIDVSKYASAYDVLFTITDNWVTTEQYEVSVDGETLGKTHGPLYYKGEEKFSPRNIMDTKLDVGYSPAGDTVAITHGAYWGSFVVPQGSKTVTVKLIECNHGYDGNFAFGWRLEKLA